MRVVGVITARGGSVRVPNKNIADLGGKPLIEWTIRAALETCDVTVVSTDSPTIAGVAISAGALVVSRPPDLSGDAPHLDVVRHAVKERMNAIPGEAAKFDVVALLQPTSPFRSADDVRAALAMYEDRKADAVISVVRFPKEDSLFSVSADTDRMRPWTEQGTIYTPNGAIYLIGTKRLLDGHDWYSGAVYGYIMPPERSLDIDTHSDLDAARAKVAEQSAA